MHTKAVWWGLLSVLLVLALAISGWFAQALIIGLISADTGAALQMPISIASPGDGSAAPALRRSARDALAPPGLVAVPSAPSASRSGAETAAGEAVWRFAGDSLSLLTFVMVVCLTIVVARSQRRGSTRQATQRLTSMIARLTRAMPQPASLPAAHADYRLVVRQGGSVGVEYPLPDLNTFIGANPGLVDLVIKDDYVSGRHATIQREGDLLYITDLGSSNGTCLNGVPLIPHVRSLLKPADLLTIGGLTLECVRHGASQPMMLSSTGGKVLDPRSTVYLTELDGQN